MVTLKEYEAYLKVKRFIDGRNEPTGSGDSPREAEIISRLMNESKEPVIIYGGGGTEEKLFF